MNLPGIQSVRCDESQVSVETNNPQVFDEWSDLDKIILVMDYYDCPTQEDPFYVSENWNINGNKIDFDIQTASDAGIDAFVNILVHPINHFDTVYFYLIIIG